MMITRQTYCLFFFLVFFVLHTFASPLLNSCGHDQRDALLEFKHEFLVNVSNSSPLLTSWNKSSDCCSWEGVTCNAESSQVISLELYSIPFNNSLKPNSGLFKLQHLRNLTLWHCNLYGEIPSSIGNLSRLTYLDLQRNDLVGEIPASVGNLAQLEYLSLGMNMFSGSIPVSFVNLTNLSDLVISNNQFTGEFPLPLLNLTTSLSNLDISNNLFKSTLPPDMSWFYNLRYFDVGGNSFSGPFPTSLFMIPSLIGVSLRENQFNGPMEFRNTSSNLRDLDLSGNKFDGPIHKSISKNSSLPNIWTLDISSNSFQGPLPHWICKLRSLEFLDLSNNSFSGFVPQCLSNIMVGLNGMNLRNNNLSGILPPDLFVNAVDLHLVDVSNNQFEGKLPESMRGCTSLLFLNVKSNRIKEKFPYWLGFLPSLQVMILRSNEFYGSLYHPHVYIGFQSIKIIDISHNDFSGTLPPFYFSSWHALTEHGGRYLLYHDLVSPYYVESYSTSIELVNKGVDTKYERIRRDFSAIDFSGNKFSGKIPESIGLLKKLRLLNLSGNSFTSNIPQSLANLTNLEALDLSGNQLSGQIPQNLGSLSFLSIVNFSHNNLEGPIPRGTQFQRQNCSSFMYNPKLYGFEDICRQTHVRNPTPQEPEDLSEPEEQVISWIAAAIAYGPGVFCGLVIGYIFSSYKHK